MSIDRRSFLAGSAVSAAALQMSEADALTSSLARGRDAAIDQIVDLFGGYAFDQDKATRLLAETRTREDRKSLPEWVKRYGRRAHAIQCAMQAEKDGVDEPFVVAGLLHDIGHIFSAPAPRGREKNYDDKHEIIGALWLRNLFVPEVSEPVLLHVPAKRYLVTTRKEYYEHLSSGSKDSLRRQGGFMKDDEVADFEKQPFWEMGRDCRIWDDNAKVKGLKLKPIEHYVPMMEKSLKRAM